VVQKGDTIVLNVLGPSGKALSDEPSREFEIMWVERNQNSSIVGARLRQGQKLDKNKMLLESGGPAPPDK
jgi:hypothetical protein